MRKNKKSIIALLLVVLMISSVIDYSGILKVDAKEQSTQAAENIKMPEENKDTTIVSSDYGLKMDEVLWSSFFVTLCSINTYL